MTKVYGQSDDLIEFDGDVSGEVGCYTSDDEASVLLIFSDGTILRAKYGKGRKGIWEIRTVHSGGLLNRVNVCKDEDAKLYSDVAHFRDGLTWAYAATKWERVQ